MFTGIIKGMGHIQDIIPSVGLLRLSVTVEPGFLKNLDKGASIAIDGICLTVVDFDESKIWFDVIEETLRRTTLKFAHINQTVNIERSARFGDEIGGHLLSGHIFGTASVTSIQRTENNCIVSLQASPEIIKYLFSKGYVALNGASLTLVNVDTVKGFFSVHLIPETLARTTFASMKCGDVVNVEIDNHTQAIVDTVERQASRSTS